MPMPDETDRLWRVMAYDPGGPDEMPTDEEILGRLERILPERTGRDVHIVDADWLSMFSVHRRLADTYRRGRILIAGDAAHTHAPFGGQGIQTVLGDVQNLAWKLALSSAAGRTARYWTPTSANADRWPPKCCAAPARSPKSMWPKARSAGSSATASSYPCSVSPACSAG